MAWYLESTVMYCALKRLFRGEISHCMLTKIKLKSSKKNNI